MAPVSESPAKLWLIGNKDNTKNKARSVFIIPLSIVSPINLVQYSIMSTRYIRRFYKIHIKKENKKKN